METKPTPRALQAQAEQMKQIWQDLLNAQGPLRVALPADLERARAQLRAHDGDAPRGGEYHLPAFHRLATVFTHHARPMTMGEISEALNVPLSTATRMVDSLVEHGYAERLPDPQDRRIVRVALTENGKQVYQMFDQFFGERMCEFLSYFTTSERQQMLKLFRKAVTVLKKINAQPKPNP
jgi:DNA-binding MarR family transcriptional regulator